MPRSDRDIGTRLVHVAAEHADRVALRFLPGRDADPVEWTYARLAAEVDAVAAGLAGRYAPGDRALLLLPSGPDLVAALFGSVRAGLVAVPAPLGTSGRSAKNRERVAALVADCRPSVALVGTSTVDWSADLPASVEVFHSHVTGDSAADVPGPSEIAYLQYSSGSTGAPKAVANTHRTLLNQVELISTVWSGPEPIHFVGWLPLYHDMGMIQQLLGPLLTGGTLTFMAPASFAAEPARWLRAVSNYRGNWIAGPDFAYQSSCDAFTPDEVAGLDLSAVRYAINGAEPIRPGTLSRFADHFAAAGLDRDAITPAYGLAEAGLCVSTSFRPRGWRERTYDAAALAAGIAVPGDSRTLVSCGDWFHDWDVRVVDPQTRQALPDRHVGEVWVAGAGLPAGYHERPEATGETFGARLADGGGPFLRTGDLGFLDDGELFICGRRKDLIIVNGTNHHPSDIERTVEQAVVGVHVGGVCAVQSATDHTVMVIAEADRHLDTDRLAGLAADIRDAVHETHEILARDVVLVRRTGLPKTTSGKIRRSTAAASYAAGDLPVLYTSTIPLTRISSPETTRPGTAAAATVHDGLAALLGRQAVPLDTGFSALGLDSVAMTRFAHQLGVPVTMLFQHPTVRALAAALDGGSVAPASVAHASGAVAVIGVGVQLPGGIESLDALAELLLENGSVVGPPPDARARDGVPLTVPGGYLDAVDRFDAGLFGISGAEAQAMDPQQRLLLQVAWRALEDAGIVPSAARGRRMGVFVGQGHHEYAMLPLRMGRPDWVRAFHATGTSMSASAGRIAHTFGLRGPAMAVDTACSGSLVAIDAACRHLASGSCDVALAGGVNVALSPETEQALLSAGMLSPSGRCATLSADADGYARGEGAALLVLKPLDAARRDGDRILAVIRGSAVAHDGYSSGLTVPNPSAQADVIRDALAAASLAPDDIDAVELHGTGTPLGDPIEISALASVHVSRERPLRVGSIKANLGHLEAAAGVAGVLRALVALRHNAWPGSPTLSELNPALDGIDLPYRWSSGLERFSDDSPLRRVGVSSFGFTGTVAHLVLESVPASVEPELEWIGWVPLAGASPEAVRRRAEQLRRALAGLDSAGQARVLSGWRRHREHLLPWRAVVTANDADELDTALASVSAWDASAPGVSVLRVPEADSVEASAELYRRGAALDWAALDRTWTAPSTVDPSTLPSYPFEPVRHWYPVSSVPAVPGPGVLTFEDMRSDVAALLDRSTVDPAADLVAAGLDSIRLMDLAARWRRAGVALTFAEMFARPTLDAWWERSRPVAAGLAAVDESAPFALTPVQHAYWIGRDPGQPLGGVGCHVYAEIDGTGVDPDRLERAVFALTERHGMLRAVFDDDGRQRIRPASPWPGLTVHHDPDLAALRDRLSHRLLDVANGEVFDIQLSVRPSGATRMHVNVDMLVADALSLQILLADLADLYAGIALTPIEMSFPRYLASRSSGDRERARTYWRERDLPAPPQLPVQPVEGPVRFVRLQHQLPADAWQRLVRRARDHGVTPSVALAAAFTRVLAAWSEQPRFRLMMTLFDREDLHPDVATVIADFTSLTLLSVDASPGTFGAFASDLQEQLREDLDHAAWSGVEVLRDLARAHGPEAATAPVVFTSNLGREILTRDTFGTLGWTISQTPQVWLDHQVMEHDGGLLLTWDAVPAVFRPGVLDAMFAAYVAVIGSLPTADWAEAVPVPVHTAVRDRVNQTAAPVSGRLLHEGFFANALSDPARIAVRFGAEGSVSYGELSRRALRVAGWLRVRGVLQGDPVGVCLPKGPDQIVAVLGVLAAGGVYVPVGVDQPSARRDAILRAAGVCVVLDAMPDDAEPLAAPVSVDDDALAYVIFTSGSTGVPKGVEITHRSAVNTVEDINDRYRVTADDRVLAVSALDFDLSVYDIFGLLTAGGSVVCISEDERRDAYAWVSHVRRHAVTVWNTVPALLDMLLMAADDLPTLRLAMVSGDWVGLDLHPRLLERTSGCRLIALGGATEAAIWSNAFEVTGIPAEWRSIPYGFPLRNQSYRVVDPSGGDRPDWVPGELWIGGVGVAHGYRGDPARTAERFVTHAGHRFYRTGDQGRYWPDGTLEFLGRTDHQVKIRGHRIELGEIETVLTGHPAVTAAVATATGGHLAAAISLSLGGVDGPPGGPVVFSTDAVEEAVTEKLLVDLLGEVGFVAALEDAPVPLAELAAAAGIAEPMTGLLRLWCAWLFGRGVLQNGTPAGYTAGVRLKEVAGSTIDLSVSPVVERIRERFADLVAILRGDEDPAVLLDDPVLAPEALVDSRPDVGDALATLATELAGPLRIAEIGGRGGLTALRLLPQLEPGAVEYTVLDGSVGLLATARERLAGLPHDVRFRRHTDALDLDLLHAFDVVIANNAVHRHADPGAALVTAGLLLAPGGRFVALESTDLSPLALLTVAIPERGFTGPDGIARTPLRDAEAWRRLLDAAGLANPTTEPAGSGLLWLRATNPPAILESSSSDSVHNSPRSLDGRGLNAWVSERLPYYMHPERVVVFGAMPLSANGKVDRAAVAAVLARQRDHAAPERHAEPATEAERLVAELWAELLGHARVGRDDDFFTLGGDSLLGTRFVTRLRAAGATATLASLFTAPRLADFAATVTFQGSGEESATVKADPAHRHDPFPATDVQRAYWLGRRSDFTLGGVATHYYTEFDGTDVDLSRLEDAWNRLVERHDMLRAVFDDDGNQRILDDVPEFRIATAASPAELRDAMSHQVLDPGRWPLFDMRAAHHGDGRTRLGLSLDNLILDGLSMRILITELATLYDDPTAALPPVRITFRDYVTNAPPATAEAEEYWRTRLTDLPAAPQLPLRTDPSALDTPRFTRREATVPAPDWQRIVRQARKHGLTPSAVLLTCFAEVLGAWSDRADLTINLTLFDRREVHPDINRVLGDFTSLLLLAYQPRPADGFLQRARRLQQRLWEDLEHRDVSAMWVLRELARHGPNGAAMPVVFTSAIGVGDEVTDHRARAFPERVWGVSQTPQVWLDHQVYEERGALVFNWDAVEDLFSPGVLDTMFAAYHGVLSRLVFADWADPVPSLVPADQLAVRGRANATAGEVSGRLLHEGFFEHATASPDAVAVRFGPDGRLTYEELSRRALRVAGWLRVRGVLQGDPVGVCLPKGPDQIVAVLGVLAAGGVYVPVGVDQPPVRRETILTAAGVRAILDEDLIPDDAEPLAAPVSLDDDALAYVIFTSGSTGVPKGVEITHRSAVNTIEDLNSRFGITGDDRVLAVSALDFDLSVYDIFGLLAAGGTVVCVSEDERRDAYAWAELVRRHGVTVWNTVPALLDMLLTVATPDDLKTVRLAMVSGDWVGLDLHPRLVESRPGARLIAMGGATEAAIWSNAFEVTGIPAEWRSIPYGFPLRNQCYRVVDEQGRDRPDWVPGELWIGGVGVAHGYRGDPARTAERFVTHAGHRFYRTGDQGRYWPDGTLEFLGRTDHQVKIRGHRIELGEIETVLKGHPAVGAAVVTAHAGHLVAAITVTGDPDADTADLTTYLGPRLPGYMIPDRTVVFDDLPLSANGKVDRAAIAALLAATTAAADDEPPQGEVETELARIWAELLGVATVGRQQSFFSLGGDSLAATRLVEAVRRRFATRIPLRQLYAAPTVAALATHLDQLEDLEDGTI